MSDKAVEWLREQVQERLDLAQKASTGEPWEADQHYDGLWMVDLKPSAGPVDSPEDLKGEFLELPGADDYEAPRFLPSFVFQAQHIAANDPQDAIARCQADLAILDEHVALDDDPAHCARCQNWRYTVPAPWPCTTVRSVTWAYRHRAGYAEHWGDAAIDRA